MATKTTTKKAASSEKKESSTTKKTASKSSTLTASTTKKVARSTKKVDTPTNIENKITRKDEQTTSSMPVRHERQFGQNKFYMRRKKFCKLCAKGIEHVDYKDIELLSKYLNHNMKISSRKQTSACASHQRRISNAIKRARIVALIHCVKD